MAAKSSNGTESTNYRPNVIWIMADQLRTQALGLHGDPNVSTPNIDNLAIGGMDFERAVSGFPNCCPFRGSLLTSTYPHHCVPGHEYPLPRHDRTVATVLNENRYHTAWFGKWHLDGFTTSREHRGAFHVVPEDRRGGFQTWIGYENNENPWDCYIHGTGIEEPTRLDGYETDSLTTLVLDYLKERSTQEQPFFCVLSVIPPHSLYTAPSEFMANRNPAAIALRENVPMVRSVVDRARRELYGYYAAIENLDHNVGRIMSALRRLQIDRNTHVVFLSDHGDMLGSHGYFVKIKPYQESIGIPFIIGAEKGIHHGRRRGTTSVPLNHVDIAPTTLGLCGIAKPDWMCGTDYSFLRLADREPEPNLPTSAYLQVIKLTYYLDTVDQPYRGIVTGDGWKYVCFGGSPWLLFDLNEDPFEQVNLAHLPRYKEKKIELHQALSDWIQKTADEFPLPRIEYAER